MNMTKRQLASHIEHTLLVPHATEADIAALCEQAIEYRFAAVCVNPRFVRRAASRLARETVAHANDRPVVVSVAGFPLGANRPETKADEAARAMDEGATEIDMVIPIGALIEGDQKTVRHDIECVAKAVHRATPSGKLKVILETAALDDEQIIAGCRCAAEGEADFVKTSTGMHANGGATIAHVRLLRRCASPLGIKAAGGIRTTESAIAMIEAGASRIGTSSGITIVEAYGTQYS